MPFELTNAPAYFMDLMNRVFRGQLNKFVVMLIDNILVFFKGKEKREDHLRVLLETLKRHQLKVKFANCHF